MQLQNQSCDSALPLALIATLQAPQPPREPRGACLQCFRGPARETWRRSALCGRSAGIEFGIHDCSPCATVASWWLTFELSRHRRWDALDSKRKMGRRPSACWPAWPAVGARLERRVRHRGCWHERDYLRLNEVLAGWLDGARATEQCAPRQEPAIPCYEVATCDEG